MWRGWREAACWFTWSQAPICIPSRRWKIGFLCRSSWLRQISGTLRPGAGLAERPSQQTWAWGPVAPIPLASTGTHILLQPLQQLVERRRATVGFLGVPWGCLDFLMPSGFKGALPGAHLALTSLTSTFYPSSLWGLSLWALSEPPELKLGHVRCHSVLNPSKGSAPTDSTQRLGFHCSYSCTSAG